MKAKERHELKTNELADMLLRVRDGVNQYGVHIAVGIVILAAGLFGLRYMRGAKQRAASEIHQEIKEIKFDTPDNVATGLGALKSLADRTTEPEIKTDLLLQLGSRALTAAMINDAKTVNREALDQAAEAFADVVEVAGRNPVAKGGALLGLATVEATRFALDNDMSHKASYERYVKQVVEGGEFNGYPCQNLATKYWDSMDETFVQVEFAPPTTTQPAESPDLTGPPASAAPITITPTESAVPVDVSPPAPTTQPAESESAVPPVVPPKSRKPDEGAASEPPQPAPTPDQAEPSPAPSPDQPDEGSDKEE